jgi:heterotetrameric sarcosine oxidase gamma subunit
MVESRGWISDVHLVPVEQSTQWLLHAEPAHALDIGRHTGIDLPGVPLTSSTTGEWSALHLAPDEWLLIAEGAVGDPRALFDGAPHPLSLVDVSDRSRTLEVIGSAAPQLLAGACSMNLCNLADGACTRTLFGKVTVMVWRRAGPWRLTYARSYHEYVRSMLTAISKDLEDDVSA